MSENGLRYADCRGSASCHSTLDSLPHRYLSRIFPVPSCLRTMYAGCCLSSKRAAGLGKGQGIPRMASNGKSLKGSAFRW